VPAVTYQRRRRDLAGALRELRVATGLSGSEFARRLGWIQSRVSKLETAKQFPVEADLEAWADAAAAAGQLPRLLDLLAAARAEYATWQETYRAAGGAANRQGDYIALERQARHIRKFAFELPAQLMTARYAREHLALPSGPAAWGASHADIDEMVTVRLRRQEILSDPGKSIQIVMPEAALHTRLCSTAAIVGQLDRLLAADGLPALELTIIPFTARVPVYLVCGFVIYDDELVLVETLTGEQRLNDPDEIGLYTGWFDLLADAGVRGRDAAALIRGALEKISADGEGRA
jgi:transcriptional regulator with XRE-family HTH domain